MAGKGMVPDPTNERIKIPGFAPNRAVSVANGSVDVSGWTAYCLPVDAGVQYNGAGGVTTVFAGSVRVIPDTVNTITFSGITGTVQAEVM